MNEEKVVITRVFDAPRIQVFEAWTRAEHLEKWFAPRGYAITGCESDPRPGGRFALCMRSPRGEGYWVRGAYREVVPPQRLVIACALHDPQGVARLDEIIDVEFEQVGSRTRLHLNSTARGLGALAAAMLAGMQKGWDQTVDRLRELLGPKREQDM